VVESIPQAFGDVDRRLVQAEQSESAMHGLIAL
jgi:hypothetical protein